MHFVTSTGHKQFGSELKLPLLPANHKECVHRLDWHITHFHWCVFFLGGTSTSMDDCRFFPEKAIASLLADSHLCSVVLRFAYTRGEKCEQKQIDHKQTIFRLYRGPVFPSVLAHRVLQLRSTGSTAAEVRLLGAGTPGASTQQAAVLADPSGQTAQ